MSEHLREATARLDTNAKVNRDNYISQTKGTRLPVSGENEDKLDKLTGLIKPGRIVEPGDVMATIIRKNVDDLGVTSMTQVSQGDLVELRSDI